MTPTDRKGNPIDLTIASRWKDITHLLPPDQKSLWQHMDDSRYFSGDAGKTWFTVDVIPKIDPTLTQNEIPNE